MLGVVHAVLLDLERDANSDGHLAGQEKTKGKSSRPSNHGKDENQVSSKHIAVSSVENSGAFSGAGRVVGRSVLLLGGEKTGGDDPPNSTESVDRNCTNHIVDLHLLKERTSSKVKEGTDEANDEGALGLN